MTFETRLIALANAIGTDIKTARLSVGDRTALTTTAKTNLVAAINELHALAAAAVGSAVIDDAVATSTTTTRSADKIASDLTTAINTLRSELTGGASSALDTFAELAAEINNNAGLAATLATGLSNRVRFDAPQVLTLAEKAQARDNVGAASMGAVTAVTDALGNTDADLVAVYVAAKV